MPRGTRGRIDLSDVLPPRLEGTVAVGGKRRLGFAEFGDPVGRPFVWLHGTPGARRQIPGEARAFGVEHGVRIIGIDRPGIGASTSYRYPNIRAFADDLAMLADALGLDEFGAIGLSGGGPYALAAAAAMPERVPVVGVLGGVAPTHGPDAIGGGLVAVGSRLRGAIVLGRVPVGFAMAQAMRVARPIAVPAISLYARLSPPGDRALLTRPEFRAMFLDDLLHGGRSNMSAPLADVLLFTRDWGFAAADVHAQVVWWHGDADHIIPYSHGVHMVSRLPDAELRTLHGESHLGGLGVPEEILTTLLERWGPTT